MSPRCVSLTRLLPAAALALFLAACGRAPSPTLLPEDGTGVGAFPGAGNEHFTGLHPSQFPIHGIDVSWWNGDIDWRAVKASGVKFAWIKATEGGDFLDPKFLDNWRGAKAAGVPRGAYHFVWWCRPGHEQVEWFKRNVPRERDALPPVLDVEFQPKSRNCRKKLDRGEVVEKMRLMLREMEQHYGRKPVIYVTVDFYAQMMHPNEFEDYPVWVRSTKYEPSVHYPGRRWVFWQYQSDGAIPGIRGKTDRNAFVGTREQWRAWLAGGR
ncbi:MAG: GH25 family lysozyme [Beijerinckiaceae bacterium]|jgi:lysozyme